MPKTNVPRRERIERQISPEPNSGCWLWTGGIGSHGYGQLTAGWRDPQKRGTSVVHRILYEEKYGPVPKGLELDHLCRVRLCVNPDHLEPVTRRENIRRGIAPVARQMVQTHCLRGHEFNHANTLFYRTKYGVGRRCKTCAKLKRRT